MHPRITIFLIVAYLLCKSLQRSIEEVPHPSMEMGEIKPPNGSIDDDTSESEVDVSRRWPSRPWKPRHHHTTTRSPTSQNAPLLPPLPYNVPKLTTKTRHSLRNKFTPQPVPDDIPQYDDDFNDLASAKNPSPQPPHKLSIYPDGQSNQVFQKPSNMYDEQDGEDYVPWNTNDIEGIPVEDDADDADDQGDVPSEQIPPVANKRRSRIRDGSDDQDAPSERIPPVTTKGGSRILDGDDDGQDVPSEWNPPVANKRRSRLLDGSDDQDAPSERIPPVTTKRGSRILDGDDDHGQDEPSEWTVPSEWTPPIANKRRSRIPDGDDDTMNSDMDVDMNGGVPSVPKDTEYVTVLHEKKCKCRLQSNRMSSIIPASKGPDSENGEPFIDERNFDEVKKSRVNEDGRKFSNFKAPGPSDQKGTETTKQILDDIGHWSVSCPMDHVDLSLNGPTILEGVKCTLVKEGPDSMGPSTTEGKDVQDNGDQYETLERDSYGNTSDEEDEDDNNGSRNGRNYVYVQRKGGKEQDIMQAGPRTMDDERREEEKLNADK